MSNTTLSPAPQVRRKPPWRARLLPYLFVAIPLVYLLVFQGYSIVQGILLSLTNTQLLNPSGGEFVGLKNFQDVIGDPDFWNTLMVTLLYTLGCVVGAVGIGLGAALILNRPFRGKAIIRSIVMIPWAAPGIAVVMVFIWIFNNQYGVANFFLKSVGLEALLWRSDPNLGLPSVLLVSIWQLFPLCALVLLAAMQSVPAELYDAARTDGAGAVNVVRYVTLPSIMPTLVTITLFITIWSLRRFDTIWVMTQGGPAGRTNTIVIDIYRETFQFFNVGRGAALGIVGMLIAVAITLFYFVMSNRMEKRDNRV